MDRNKCRLALLLDDYRSEYAASLERGAAEFCTDTGAQLTVFSVGSVGAPYHNFDYQLRAPISLITSENFDGVILSASTQRLSSEQLSQYVAQFGSVPCVSIGVDIPGMSCVMNDCTPGLRTLILHLIDVHRCRNIALMSVRDSPEAEEREAFIRRVLNSRGITVGDDAVIYGDFTYSSAVQALSQYVRDHRQFDYDAVIALNDDMAFGCIDFCRQQFHGRNVIVTGYDNLERSSYSKPTLTTVDQRVRKQGFIAARTLCMMIKGDSVPRIQTVPSMALFRQSCGCINIAEMEVNALDMDGRKIMFSDPFGKSTVGEWYMRKGEFQRIINYQSECQGAVSLRELRRRLSWDITTFDIAGFAICLFREPVRTDGLDRFIYPKEMYVFAAHDVKTGFMLDETAPDIVFDPSLSIVPPSILDAATTKYYCVPIYNRSMNFGYIVFLPGSDDSCVYDLLCRTVSTSIDMAYSYSQEEFEKGKLSENNRMLSSMSQTDEMTHLLNRRGLMNFGQQTVDLARSRNLDGIAVFCDMDGLKKINDTYGHDAGDRAIKVEASLLKSAFRSTDVIGRFGGDEFVIIVLGMDESVIGQLRYKISQMCAGWNRSSEEKFNVSISLGCAAFSTYGYDLKQILKAADSTLYDEKRRKKAAEQKTVTDKGGKIK